MNNCQNCKHHQNMGSLVGCDKQRTIVTNPYEEKACCEHNVMPDFLQDIFDKYSRGKETANVY